MLFFALTYLFNTSNYSVLNFYNLFQYFFDHLYLNHLDFGRCHALLDDQRDPFSNAKFVQSETLSVY